jgi:hypothetical protein
MASEEGCNLSCPFAGQERTHCIDQPPTRPHQFGAKLEKPLLNAD